MNEATLLACGLLAATQVGARADFYETVYHKPVLKAALFEVVQPASVVRFMEERSIVEERPYDEDEYPLVVTGQAQGRGRWVELPVEFPEY